MTQNFCNLKISNFILNMYIYIFINTYTQNSKIKCIIYFLFNVCVNTYYIYIFTLDIQTFKNNT